MLPFALNKIEAKRQPWSAEAFTQLVRQQHVAKRYRHKLDYVNHYCGDDHNNDGNSCHSDDVNDTEDALHKSILQNDLVEEALSSMENEDVIQNLTTTAFEKHRQSSGGILGRLRKYKSHWSQKLLYAMENVELEMRHATRVNGVEIETMDEDWNDQTMAQVNSRLNQTTDRRSISDGLVNESRKEGLIVKFSHHLIPNRSRKKQKTTMDDIEVQEKGGILTQREREVMAATVIDLLQHCENALADHGLWEVLIDDEAAISAGHKVKIWKTHYDVLDSNSRRKMTQEPTVLSETIMDASPSDVFRLFKDNSRVHEYNDNCVELHDIESINEETKISWCATAKIGPFKARDFVTLVHYCDHKGGFASVAAHVDHPLLPPAEGYVRAQIQINATFMHPIPNEPNKTCFIQMTRVGELGSILDSPVARKVSQQIQENAPIDFSKKFNEALKRRHPIPNKNISKSPPFAGMVNMSYET